MVARRAGTVEPRGAIARGLSARRFAGGSPAWGATSVGRVVPTAGASGVAKALPSAAGGIIQPAGIAQTAVPVAGAVASGVVAALGSGGLIVEPTCLPVRSGLGASTWCTGTSSSFPSTAMTAVS